MKADHLSLFRTDICLLRLVLGSRDSIDKVLSVERLWDGGGGFMYHSTHVGVRGQPQVLFLAFHLI